MSNDIIKSFWLSWKEYLLFYKNPENDMTDRAWADPRQQTSAVYNKESIGSEM